MRIEGPALLPLLALVACGPTGTRSVKFEGDALGAGGGGTGGSGGTGGPGGVGGGGAGTGGLGGAGGRGGTGGSGGTGGLGGGSGGTGGLGGGSGGTGGSSFDAGRDQGRDLASPDVPLPPDMRVPDTAPPPPPDAAPSSLNMGLVSRWKLDEGMGNTADDSAGNNNGTLSGAAWVTTGFPAAKYPNRAALRFTAGDHVQLGIAGMPANNRAQSISLWLNYASVPTANAAVCISLTDGGGGSRVKVGFKEGRLAAFKGGTDPTLVSFAPPAAGWHHMVYTFDGNVHRLYVDGTQRSMSTIGPNNGSVTQARLGGNTEGSEDYTGLLDEVRVYNRALSLNEVGALFNGEE
jgi:hypothetical protein